MFTGITFKIKRTRSYLCIKNNEISLKFFKTMIDQIYSRCSKYRNKFMHDAWHRFFSVYRLFFVFPVFLHFKKFLIF